jgi:hypothetical protein
LKVLGDGGGGAEDHYRVTTVVEAGYSRKKTHFRTFAHVKTWKVLFSFFLYFSFVSRISPLLTAFP